jgi:hypothetical protein
LTRRVGNELAFDQIGRGALALVTPRRHHMGASSADAADGMGPHQASHAFATDALAQIEQFSTQLRYAAGAIGFGVDRAEAPGQRSIVDRALRQRPGGARPSSAAARADHFAMLVALQLNSCADCAGVRSAHIGSTICRQISVGYGGFASGMSDSLFQKIQVSVKTGQIHSEHPPETWPVRTFVVSIEDRRCDQPVLRRKIRV